MVFVTLQNGHDKIHFAAAKIPKTVQNNNNCNNRIWQSQEIIIIQIIIGTLGTVSKNFEHWLRKLDIMVNFSTLQKARLSGSARVIRKILDT